MTKPLMSNEQAWAIACLDGHDQAALRRSGDVGPDVLVEAAIARIVAIDPALNAVSHRSFAHARAAAASVDPALAMAGVPYLLKASLEYPGFPVQSGSRAKRDVVAARAFALVGRFDDAGLVPVGMSTMPEFGLNASGEALLYGPTRNPWDLARSSGGSSSGAGAAVAAGLVPFAHGSDAGGSIRIPASNCGIIGFKPSRGWNVRARAYNLVDDILCSDSLYGRSMRDTVWAARFLRPGNCGGPPVDRSRRLRIAIDLQGMNGRGADADVAAVIERVGALCAGLGHHVEHRPMPVAKSDVRAAFGTLWAYLGGEITDLFPAAGLEPWTLGLAGRRATITPEQVVDAFAQIDRAMRALAVFHTDFDVVLSPVTRSIPPLLGHLAPTREFGELWDALFDYVDYTPLHNMTGAASISLPLFADPGGLPVGAMFSGDVGSDEMLLTLATELESAQPWAGRWPPISLSV
jgi:amidase